MFSDEIRNRIREFIPKRIDKFPKLKRGEPYRFHKWGYDREGRFCLYYVVTGGKEKYPKRIPIEELEAAVVRLLETGKFNREDFRELCPVANSDGPCGFTVIGRILEALYGAMYEGRGRGFEKMSF
ncbi:hypothetical protein Asulf_01149 [Archaeoglobus sulfaticallidus PM70-1]|uniref:Uncharacterized protein n=1 Tax=Archaeoglobus sulfaticallidus PM70-1 TaxID=387631 RepID=N0BBZ9_9EURY|nr:hypothetical protein [Archaeoglobus sulfaticallidus]AGK61149.1 hypothetical protein Asulf_01149 [Archaeoglobus sulfaticallidus PM70-1]